MKLFRRMALMVALVTALVTGWAVPPGQAYDLLVGRLQVNDIFRYDGSTGSPIGTFISGSELNGAEGLAIGPDGNLYVSSALNNSILRYGSTTGTFLGVFASGGALDYPQGLAFGPDGNLYVCSTRTGSVLRYSGSTGAFMDIFASGGGLSYPVDLAFGPDGNLYVSSTATVNGGATGVLRYNGTTGAFMGIFASGGGMGSPRGLTFGSDGKLYVSSAGIYNVSSPGVLRYDGTTGAFIDIFASGGDQWSPSDLVFGPDGNLYVCVYNKTGDNGVLHYNGTTGAFMGVFASAGAGFPESLIFIGGEPPPDGPTLYAQKCATCHGPAASSDKIGSTASRIQNAIDNIGDMRSLSTLTQVQVQAIATALAPPPPPPPPTQEFGLLVSSFETDSVQRYDGTTGEFVGAFASGGGLDGPTGLAIGPDGNLYVSSFETDNVLRYSGTTGAFIGVFASGGGLNAPYGLVFGPDGNLYVSSLGTNSVLRYHGTTGAFIDTFASGGGLDSPRGLVFGADGNLYVSSAETDSVLRYNGTTGAFMGVFASIGLNAPEGLGFDPWGNLYVTSLTPSSVRRYDGTTGAFIDIFASVGVLNFPRGLVFGPDGDLYVSNDDPHSVLHYDGLNGAFIDAFVPSSPATLTSPRFMIFTGAPLAPGNLRATAIDAFAVDLEWVDNAYPPNNDDYVQIWLSDNGTSFAYYGQTEGPDFTVFEDRAPSTLSPFSGDTRFYRVRACNSSIGCSDFSNVAKPAAPPAPLPRTRLTWRPVVSADRSEIEILWTNPRRGDNADFIEIFRDSMPIDIVSGNMTSYTDAGFSGNGLVPGRTYCYEVRALNYGGYSNFSNRVCATAPAPFAIRNLVASVAIDTVAITFDTNYSATGRVEYGLANSCTPDCVFNTTVSAGNGTRHRANIRGLAPGTEYAYRALATTNGITVEMRGRFATSPVGEASPRLSISNLTVTPTLNSLAFVWQTNGQSTGQVEVGTVSPGSSECVYTHTELASTTNVRRGSQHSATVTGLSHSTEYCYRVTSSAATELGGRIRDEVFGAKSTLQGRPQLIARVVVDDVVSPIDSATGNFRFDPNFPGQMLIEVEVTNSGNTPALGAAITADPSTADMSSIEWQCPQQTNQCSSWTISRALTQSLPGQFGDLEPGQSGRAVLVFPYVPDFIYTTGGVARMHIGVSYQYGDGVSTVADVFRKDLTVLLPQGQVSPPDVSFDLIIMRSLMYRPFLNDLRYVRGEIEVGNTGSGDVHNVTVDVELPGTVALVADLTDLFGPGLPPDVHCAATGGRTRGGQRGASLVTCSIPLLTARGSRVIRFNGATSISANQDLGNMTVTVTPMAGDRDPTSNTAIVPIPRLSIPQ